MTSKKVLHQSPLTSQDKASSKQSYSGSLENNSNNYQNSSTAIGSTPVNRGFSDSDLDWHEATKNLHCPICDKPDWCYLGLDGNSIEIAICGREVPVPNGWVKFGQTKDDRIKYRREIPDRHEKAKRPPQTREWIFYNSNEEPLAKKVRWDYEDKPKKIRRQYFVDGKWRWSLPKDTNKSEFEAQVMPLHFDEIEIAREIGDYIVIAEGETQVDAFREKGFVATWFLTNKLEDYHVSLFEGANVVIPVDRDKEGIKKASAIYEKLKDRANSIYFCFPYPQSSLWDNVPKKDGLDMADYLDDFDMTPEEIKGMFNSDRRYFEKLYKMPSQNSRGEKAVAVADSEDDKPKRLTTAKLLKFVQEHYDLAFNEMSRELELNGQPLRNEPYILLAKDHNIEAGKDKALDIFSEIAKENAYNPVKDYLEKCSKNTLPIDISNLASRYFGTSNPLYDKFVERMLISAVARVYEPGCKVDTALILQGAQGLGKSTFFDILGGEYFDDSMGNGSDKDDLLTLHKSWIQEWGELDRIFGKRQVGEVKHFLSKRKDNYRVPYGRKTECYPRHSIIVGSVNDAQFLNDPTGDRRFWVIPVAVNEIDTETLKKERDSIWSAAVAKYKSGEQWWLSRQEQLESNRNNSDFRTNDEWETIIEDYLQNQTITSTYELLTQALSFEPKQIDGKARIRVADCLKALGWQKSSKKTTYKGKRQYTWYNLNSVTDNQGGQKGAIARMASQSEDGTDVTDGMDNSQSLTAITNDNDNLNCSHHDQLSQERLDESVPSVTDKLETPSNEKSEPVSPSEQKTVTTETSVPDIQEGDTIKYRDWMDPNKIIASQVEKLEPSGYRDGSFNIHHEFGSFYTDTLDDVVEVINQWGQIKWKR